MEGDSIGTEECQWDNDNLDFLLESIGNDLSSISNPESIKTMTFGALWTIIYGGECWVELNEPDRLWEPSLRHMPCYHFSF